MRRSSRVTTHLGSRFAPGGSASSTVARWRATARSTTIATSGGSTSTAIPSRKSPWPRLFDETSWSGSTAFVPSGRSIRRQRRKLGKSTIQNALNLLRAAFEMAVERQVLGSNPASGVKVPRRVAATHQPWTYLLLEEQDAIWACKAIPEHHYLWMQVAVGTGMREGEQFNLLLSDVHMDVQPPEIVVRYGSKAAGPKSTRGKLKIRHVPLFGLGLRAMQRWLELLPSYCRKNPLGLVFPGPTGARRQPGKHLHVTRRDPETKKPKPVDPMPEYLAAAGIVVDRRHDRKSVRWHDLRHTCAAALVSGMWGRRWSLEEVKGLLGHESITTTERYAHLAQSALKTAAAEAERAVVSPPISPPRPRFHGKERRLSP